MHVIANQDSPKDANPNSILPRDAPEDTTDVLKDVWEEDAKSVHVLNASIMLINPIAEDL